MPQPPADVTADIASGEKIDYQVLMRSTPSPFARLGLGAALGSLLGLAALGACSDSAGSADAGPDAYNPCPSGERFYTGELVSWDSTPAMFKGVFDATFTVAEAPTRTDKTSPNGRFELCLADAPITELSVDATDASMFFDGLAVAEAEVLATGLLISMRSFTPAQEAAFSPRIVAGKAHVFVEVVGKQRAVTLSTGAPPTFAFDGATWAPASAGATGAALFFANLEPSATAATASMSGSHLGGKRVPLVANRITYLTVVGK